MTAAWRNRRKWAVALMAGLALAIVALALIFIQQLSWSGEATQIAHLHDSFPGARCNGAAVTLGRTDANGIVLTANHNQLIIKGSADCMSSLRAAAARRGFVARDGVLTLSGRPGETETLAFTGATTALWSEDK